MVADSYFRNGSHDDGLLEHTTGSQGMCLLSMPLINDPRLIDSLPAGGVINASTIFSEDAERVRGGPYLASRLASKRPRLPE